FSSSSGETELNTATNPPPLRRSTSSNLSESSPHQHYPLLTVCDPCHALWSDWARIRAFCQNSPQLLSEAIHEAEAAAMHLPECSLAELSEQKFETSRDAPSTHTSSATIARPVNTVYPHTFLAEIILAFLFQYQDCIVCDTPPYTCFAS